MCMCAYAMYVRMHVCVCVCYVCTYVCMYVCLPIHVHVYVCMYGVDVRLVCFCVCVSCVRICLYLDRSSDTAVGVRRRGRRQRYPMRDAVYENRGETWRQEMEQQCAYNMQHHTAHKNMSPYAYSRNSDIMRVISCHCHTAAMTRDAAVLSALLHQI